MRSIPQKITRDKSRDKKDNTHRCNLRIEGGLLFGTISFLFQTDRSKKQASGVDKKKMGSSAERVSEKGEGVCFFFGHPCYASGQKY